MHRGVGLLLLGLAACTRTLVDYETATYVVQPGDTLTAIAWRYGLDPESVAAWNDLSDPDLIRPGQRLVLRSQQPVTAPRSEAPAPRRAPAPSAVVPARAPVWQWPTRGTVVSNFGRADSLASGIAIAGVEGQTVAAAAGGRVVYAGDGLIGYGQLIIIRHNETYLSAYGHNRRLLVAQGDEVRTGQPIAEMGLGPDRSPRLHFEIRRDGTPIDPLPQLRVSG